MARPRKPTQLHIVSGSAQKHPDRMREREDEPVVDGVDLREADAPDHLDGLHKDLWNELKAQLHARVASDQDAVAFEALVRLVMIMRLGKATAAEFARLQAYLGEFGMTPASRSKVSQSRKSEQKKGFGALKAVG